MKNLILFISFFSILFSVESHSQLSQPVRLTNGNNDRNPSFSKTPFFLDLGAFEFEFLVFERVNGNYSQICVSKIGPQ